MNRIKDLRKQKGLTQEELGKLLNVQKAAVSKYELGRAVPSTDVLMKLAEIFRVTTDYILGRPSTPSELWRSIVLSTHFEPSYLAIQLGISASEMSYLEHQKDDKVSEDTRSKLIGLYQTLNSQVKVGWNKPLEKSFDIMKEIQQSIILECDGKKYRLDDNLRDKLYTAIKLALM